MALLGPGAEATQGPAVADVQDELHRGVVEADGESLAGGLAHLQLRATVVGAENELDSRPVSEERLGQTRQHLGAPDEIHLRRCES